MKKLKTTFLFSTALLIVISLGVIFFLSKNIFFDQKETYQFIKEVSVLKEARDVSLDKEGRVITDNLKKIGIDLGFISSTPFRERGSSLVVGQNEKDAIDSATPPDLEKELLDSILETPEISSVQKSNVLVYQRFNIEAPIIHSNLDDFFRKKSDGTIDFSRMIDTSGTNSPVQKKLEQGIVHLAFSPEPGEVGNSFIIGHSSNYSSVRSDYNKIFAPLQEKSEVGDEFIIYDRKGRKLRFRVFEVLKVAETDVQEAYKKFPDKRVVTLQTSILGIRDGKVEATHRWLTRGEFTLPE